MQHMTRHQIPASCRVEPQYIWTFDNKTYSYELNDCYHLLFKDCAQQIPVPRHVCHALGGFEPGGRFGEGL